MVLDVNVLSFVAKGRVAGPNLKLGHAGEAADQGLGDAVAEIVGIGVSALVGKRKDGDGIGPEVEIVGDVSRLKTGKSFVFGFAMADRKINDEYCGKRERNQPGSETGRGPIFCRARNRRPGYRRERCGRS